MDQRATNFVQQFMYHAYRQPYTHTTISSWLEQALAVEAYLRQLYATTPLSPVLSDPYVGILDLYLAPECMRRVLPRPVNSLSDLQAHHLFPLHNCDRGKRGDLSVALTIEDFRVQWDGFSAGMLSDLVGWRGVVVAGGAVHASLLPLSAGEERHPRDYYLETFSPTSDIDIFVYGMSAREVRLLLSSYYLSCARLLIYE
jgi:hypothetical protein